MQTNKQTFSFEVSSPEHLLNYWAQVFNGTVKGNCIAISGGEISLHRYSLFNIVIVDVVTNKYTEIERKFTEKSWFPIVISNNARKFKAIPEHKYVLYGGYVFTNISGVTRYSPGRINLVVIHLSIEAIYELLPEDSILKGVFDSRGSYFFEDLLTSEMMLAYQRILTSKGDRNYIRAYAWIILAEVFKQISSPTQMVYNYTLKQLEISIKAEKILLENISERKHLDFIAEKCGVSYSYLRRSFRLVYQTTMHQYLLSYRMEQAKIYLEIGNKNISEVAYLVGYSHLGHFADEFKKYFGKLPSMFIL